MSTQSFLSQSRSYNANWISFVAPNLGEGGCRTRCGKPPSKWPGNTACIPRIAVTAGLYGAEETARRSFPSPTKSTPAGSCPITSRPRDIPVGNIRQDQTDLSPHFVGRIASRMRSDRFRRTDSADLNTLISLVGRHLGRDLGNNEYAPATKTRSQGRLTIRTSRTCVRVPFCSPIAL